MKILIAGCGYLGKALGKSLIDAGFEVWGLRRNTLALKSLQMIGITPIQADLLNPDTLTRLPEVDYVVLCQAPEEKSDDYEKTYYEGTANLLAAYHTKKPKKLVLVSSTSVYGVQQGHWVDESVNPRMGSYANTQAQLQAKCLLETEELVLSSLVPSVVLRLGGIYGPKRNRLRWLKEQKIKPSFSEIYSNRIHVEDAVSAVRLMMEKGKVNEVYLGVDDKPSTQQEFYSWLCDKLAIPKIAGEGEARPSSRVSNKRCSNQKIKLLGMKLKYPTFIEGYEALMKQEGR